jgi:phosphoglycolate phosphatase-like HAD superfamily hydrolase
MKRKIIIFDLDGVLFDSVALTEQYLYDRYPSMTKEMQMEILCGNFHEELKKITLPKKEQTEEEAEACRALHTENKSKVPMYEGVKETLLELHKKGYILALNTSAYEKNSLPLLDRAGITGLFDFLGTAEMSQSKVVKFKMIEEKYGSELSNNLTILYGGSCNANNSIDLFKQKDIDGALVGSASLNADDFLQIVKNAALSAHS